MPTDPMKIVGQPAPTPEQRARVEAFAAEHNRPAKFCRAALIQAGWDEAEARRLIDDDAFVRMNTDIDFAKLATMSPGEVAAYMLRQQMLHAGRSAEEIETATAAAARDATAAAEAHEAFEASESKREAKLKNRTHDDPRLGTLTHDGYFWTTTLDLPPLGTGVEASIESEGVVERGDPPPGFAVSALLALRDVAGDAREQIERAAAEAYAQRLPDLQADYEQFPTLSDRYDPLADDADVWRMLDGPSVHVLADDEPARVIVSYSVDWDVEHGLRLGFEDGRLVEVE